MVIFFLMSVEVLGFGRILLGVHCAGLGIGLFLLDIVPLLLTNRLKLKIPSTSRKISRSF